MRFCFYGLKEPLTVRTRILERKAPPSSSSSSIETLAHQLCVSLSTEKDMGSLETERTVKGWAARDSSGVLSPYTYTLRYKEKEKTSPSLASDINLPFTVT